MVDNTNLTSENEQLEIRDSDNNSRTLHLNGMFENWFLDYASYVILDRAVPEVLDGLKPVQRRILHSMNELDDGRYNKVANIIGHTMKYHPHGDASIGDALVQLGQKELLIDMQGNWGNIYTGDGAAAPRYIEARLSKFASEVVFNAKTTIWKPSYDGRNDEPVTLPIKFPLLLAMGIEGIAVGLASKILPHNFNELIDASVKHLEGNDFELYPDFITGGLADCSKYNEGLRGGKVRCRAKINQIDKRTLEISELPAGITTSALIDSIVDANYKGKIKIKKIDDNTSDKVEIIVHLAPGMSPDTTIDALYAFTLCEVSISPNSSIIKDNKPVFLSVKEILKISTQNTLELLKLELEIKLSELMEKLLFSSLEKIFIENRLYRKIEESESWEEALSTIAVELHPYKLQFYREITQDDILKLTEIKIKRISKYNNLKADEIIKGLEDEKKHVEHNLNNLVAFAINYFKSIKEKYGKGKERKTELRSFDNIEAVTVAIANQKLYIDRENGFAGIGLKKNEYVCECSDIDDIIAFRDDGTFIVSKVADKFFIGKNIIHIDVFRKNDDRTIYNAIYRDGANGNIYVKRFAALGINRDKEYNITKGIEGSKILYFTANPNGEAETIKVLLRPKPKLKKPNFEFNFSQLAIKGRAAQGNILTRHAIKKISQVEVGHSTLSARNIWFDDAINRLNTDERGYLLGAFEKDDKIAVFYKSGYYKVYNFDLNNHFDDDILLIEKYNDDKNYTAIYYNVERNFYYLKRFQIEVNDKKNDFTDDNADSKLILLSNNMLPQFVITFENSKNNKEIEDLKIIASEFIDVKSYKAKGKRLSTYFIKKIKEIEPLPYITENTNKDNEFSNTDNQEVKTNAISISLPETKLTNENNARQMSLDF